MCDFWDSSFQEFILESVKIDIYAAGNEKHGTSKANRLRLIWKKEDDSVVSILLGDLIDYWVAKRPYLNKPLSSKEYILLEECKSIVLKLKRKSEIISSEYTLQRLLLDSLLDKIYPEESFCLDWKSDEEIFKLAILDPETKKLLSVFEYYVSSPVVVTTKSLREILEKYKKLSIDPRVPLYIVNATQGSSGFAVHRILYSTKDSNSPHYVKVKELLSFSILKNNIIELSF